MVRWGAAGSSPQSKTGANGKKGARTSAGAMNLLASAAEDNEAYENTLTHAQLQQLQQHLLAQQFQVSMMHADATYSEYIVNASFACCTVLVQSMTCESASLLHVLTGSWQASSICTDTSLVVSRPNLPLHVHECLQSWLWSTLKTRMHECTIGPVLDVPKVVKWIT